MKQNTSEHVTCSHTAAYTQTDKVTDAGNYATGKFETGQCRGRARQGRAGRPGQ